MVLQYASHQTLFIQALHEHVARNGLQVRILDYKDFPSGQVVSPCSVRFGLGSSNADKHMRPGGMGRRIWLLTDQHAPLP